MTNFPCLRAEIVGGAFVHERWGDLGNARLIALCESTWAARQLAMALAGKDAPETSRAFVITDSNGGPQEVWHRARVDAERAKEQST